MGGRRTTVKLRRSKSGTVGGNIQIKKRQMVETNKVQQKELFTQLDIFIRGSNEI